MFEQNKQAAINKFLVYLNKLTPDKKAAFARNINDLNTAIQASVKPQVAPTSSTGFFRRGGKKRTQKLKHRKH